MINTVKNTPGIMVPKIVEELIPRVPAITAIATITLENPSKNTPIDASRSDFLKKGIFAFSSLFLIVF